MPQMPQMLKRKPNNFHSTHCPIDLSSRNVAPVDGTTLLSKGPSFCPVPRDINWHKCRLISQSFVDKVRWADFYFDHNSGDTSNSPDTLYRGGGELVDFYDGGDHVHIWGLRF